MLPISITFQFHLGGVKHIFSRVVELDLSDEIKIIGLFSRLCFWEELRLHLAITDDGGRLDKVQLRRRSASSCLKIEKEEEHVLGV